MDLPHNMKMLVNSINSVIEISYNYLTGILFGGEHHFLVL